MNIWNTRLYQPFEAPKIATDGDWACQASAVDGYRSGPGPTQLELTLLQGELAPARPAS